MEILVCNRTKNQRVVPIFYNVDPSHVRNQTGSFGEVLAKHEKNLKIKKEKEKVKKWREALTVLLKWLIYLVFIPLISNSLAKLLSLTVVIIIFIQLAF